MPESITANIDLDLSRVFEANNARGLIRVARESNEEPSEEVTSQLLNNVDSYRPVIDEVTAMIEGVYSHEDADKIRVCAAEAVLGATEGTVFDVAYAGLGRLLEDKSEKVCAEVSTEDKNSEVRVRELIAVIQSELAKDEPQPSTSLLEARTELFKRYDKYISFIARKYSGRVYGKPIDLDDLYQEGVIALMTSSERFDLSRGDGKFISYLSVGLRGKMMRYIDQQGYKGVSLPVHVTEDLRRVQKLNDWRTSRRLAVLSDGEIAEFLGIRSDHSHDGRYRNMANYWSAWRLQRMGSIDGGYSPDSDISVGDSYAMDPSRPLLSITAEVPESVEEIAGKFASVDEVELLLDELDERERTIITLRFGLEDGTSRTLEEVGEHFGLTRERIRQIESKAMAKMRHPIRYTGARDLLDA